MIYTNKIQKAIRFATKTHEIYQKQKRKGKDIPYITHPLTVGLILSRAGADEDTIVAGILHDTIEDSLPEKKVTRAMLVQRFGENVADIVESVSENNKDLPWEDRKREAREHIQTFSHDSLLVKSADLISNVTEIVADFERGETIFAQFNAPIEKLRTHYLESITAIVARWPENPLAADLTEVRVQLARTETLANIDSTLEPYWDEEELTKMRVAFVHCENEEGCGFFVEFKHPNCTFFFCKEHKIGLNFDLSTISEAGVVCEQHGKMGRYGILTEDNVCPICENSTLAIVSVGR
ncbi:hypothetical protein COU18_03300 [Candidatus Kaiserbacteria bacterium CG10_big_fil_rev_8_21_14_0_10_51_14]|uniref:HD/PDEase domain-containing protein n=1 Tax=Candidatus Kaiserbacteria bacterium CG10_big_fil_rev_8_21_14_0_10_51_14 TaxID=1974610 RepID=A0A2H0UB88_9BACT|nr:MAG: hypothetical protein COU18_03300 [Candidatus Kaiserbacteria bacterium CG10_big_fil_rev_8_21_14_0_10_51_14]